MYEILNNQKWAYQSISHEIMKYCYWMTSSQSECILNEWRSTQESQNLPWWESQKRIHQIIKVMTEYLILFVSKKNDTKQLCVNYRQLNKITKQDSYFTVDQRVARPIKQSQVIHKSRLERSLLLSTNEERQRMKTAFWTRYRHYEYTVMLFELKNTSVTFQRLINDTLREYLNDFVITYLMTFWYIQMTLRCTAAMCTRYWKSSMRGLCMWKVKEQVWNKENQILNYVIQSEQIKKNSKKDTVRNWPSSKWVKKVQVFLSWWTITESLYLIMQRLQNLSQLMHKNKRWHWDKKQKHFTH
jgi:hypothetical protein